jgi:hypothetical protein
MTSCFNKKTINYRNHSFELLIKKIKVKFKENSNVAKTQNSLMVGLLDQRPISAERVEQGLRNSDQEASDFVYKKG